MVITLAAVPLAPGVKTGESSPQRLAAAQTAQRDKKHPPNILLIIADDLAYHDLGCSGNDRIVTPNLDRLAAQGARFQSAFTPTALCLPGRWALHSGMYPHASGITGFGRIRRDLPILHRTLRKNGYRTGLIGKSARLDRMRGFDFHVDAAAGRDVAKMAAASREFMDEAGDGPWFLLVGFGDPHWPYPRKTILGPEQVRVPPYLPDTLEVRRALAGYYTAAARLDRGVGLVLEALKQSGRTDDTIVMFVSDHGPGFAFAKSTLYDAGTRVPMIVRWPGVTKPATTIDELVSFVDVYPTFLQIAGIEIPATVQGESFLPLLRGQRQPQRVAVFFSHTDNARSKYPMRGVRTAKYKYIRNFTPDAPIIAILMGRASWTSLVKTAASDAKIAARVNAYLHRPAEELYLIQDDPYELKNIIGEPSAAEDLTRLRKMVREWMTATGDPLLEEVRGVTTAPAKEP